MSTPTKGVLIDALTTHPRSQSFWLRYLLVEPTDMRWRAEAVIATPELETRWTRQLAEAETAELALQTLANKLDAFLHEHNLT